MFGFTPGPAELIVVGVIGVLLFGSKLPEVMRGLGRSIVEFRKGLHGVAEEPSRYTAPPERPATVSNEAHDEPEVPKFQISDD